MRTYPKLLRTNKKLAPKSWVCAPKFLIGYFFYIFFSSFKFNRFWQIYLVLFNSEPWDQVQIDHNAKALKLRHTSTNTELAL